MGKNKNLVGGIFPGGGMSKFLAIWGDGGGALLVGGDALPHPPVGKTLTCITPTRYCPKI